MKLSVILQFNQSESRLQRCPIRQVGAEIALTWLLSLGQQYVDWIAKRIWWSSRIMNLFV